MDDQWKMLDPLIPKPRRRRDGRGRPGKSRRSVLNGILWVLRTGAPWAAFPRRVVLTIPVEKVAFEGWETAPPVTEAGVVLIREESPDDLGPALACVLQHKQHQAVLRERSQHAQAEHFSWPAIAAKFVGTLRKLEKTDSQKPHLGPV
jgi:glycosyltransferase involved in cell wall biosynthesis